MLSSAPRIIGFVPTLEALPLVSEVAQRSDWSMQPFPSYGRVVRKMLAREIAGGLLPLDVFAVEIASRPVLADLWTIPLVMPGAPIELVVSHRVMKMLNSDPGKTSNEEGLTISIESRHSLTRHQFIAWQSGQPSLAGLKTSFRMLPMELMQKAVQAETVDGFLAPAPWGMMVEKSADLHLVPNFAVGKLAQQLVLGCNRELSPLAAAEWQDFASALLARRLEQQTNSDAWHHAADQMSASGKPVCDMNALRKSAERYQMREAIAEFCPAPTWLKEQIGRIARLIPALESQTADVLARKLSLNPADN